VFTAAYDKYKYYITSEVNPVNAYKLAFDINQLNFKADFNYYLGKKHTVDFGASHFRYKLNPGQYQPVGKESFVASRKQWRQSRRLKVPCTLPTAIRLIQTFP
jgi:hypothetical protein